MYFIFCYVCNCFEFLDLAENSSSYKRHLFIDVCFMTIELFSRSFFKEHFFETVLHLMLDKVPNIRLRLCPLLPLMKRMLKIPGDRLLLQRLEQSCQKMINNERDRDVRPAFEKVAHVY